MKRIDNIIIRPLLTEKASMLQEAQNTYAFEVGTDASKIEIKQTIQELFGVQVTKVCTQVVRGKNKRFGRYYGKRSNWKKALVTVAEGETLDFYTSI
jgi:large subunit ribosomal protein L23